MTETWFGRIDLTFFQPIHSIFLLILCSILFLTACGSSDQKASSPPQQNLTTTTTGQKSNPPVNTNMVKGKIDPCSLITKAEAEAAIGEKVEDPTTEDGNKEWGQTRCVYSSASESSAKFVQISVVQTESITEGLRQKGYTTAKLLEDTRTQVKGKPISGIGDDAYWGNSNLHVLKKDAYITISTGLVLNPKNEPAAIDTAKTLALKAVERL
jgi:hypothetical protein